VSPVAVESPRLATSLIPESLAPLLRFTVRMLSRVRFQVRFALFGAILGMLTPPPSELGLNPYDVRKPCVGGDTCYEELDWVDTFMNNATVKAQLGVDPARNFTGGSALVYLSFRASGDGMRNSAPLLTDLVNDGIRLLVYAGNAGAFGRGVKIGAFIRLNDSQTAFATTSVTNDG